MDLPRPFGPYTLLRRLAVGGMAEVYVARAQGIGGFEKLVAIKVIHPRFSEDEHFVQMLVEEAKITVLLNHVNIAQIFDLGCIEDTYFIVMEYIEGADAYRTLKRAADRSMKLPLDVCAFVASEVCNGLDYAHRKRDSEGKPLGIVHRDISPQNVLLSYAGEVKLVDFGIAKAALRTGQTEAGVIKGKYYYMSPEQAWGDPMDHRSDIFSTGVVLYELLTGDMLYQEDNIPQLLDKVRKADIEPPSTRRPDIPPELDQILLKAVAKRPDDRYQSAHEMGQDLAQLVYGLTPSFTASRLSALMADLFEEELRRYGSSVARTSGERRLPSVPPARQEEPTHSAEVMGAGEYAADRTKSIIFDLDDDEDEDATRNDVLPYRRRLEMQRQREERERQRRERERERQAAQRGGPPAGEGAAGPTRPLRPVRDDPEGEGDVGAEVSGEATLVQDRGDEPWDDETVEKHDASADWEDDEATMVNDRDEVVGQASPPGPPPRAKAAVPPPPPARPMPARRPPPPAPAQQRPSVPSGGPWPAIPAPAAPPRRSHWPEPSPNEFDSEPPTEVWSGSPAQQQRASSVPPQSFPAVRGTPSGHQAPGVSDPFVARPGVSDLETAGYAALGKERNYKALIFVALAIAALIGLGALGAWLFAPAPPEPVLEVISVPPGAHVTLDGRDIAEAAPVRITRGLALDRQHRVEVSMEGYETWTTTFQPTRGLVKQIAVLRPERATLHVESVPEGAHVWVDDVLWGSAPLDVPGLSIGREVSLRATKPGYREARQTLTVDASNLEPTVSLELEERDD